MRLIVQKFGGSSVATADGRQRIAEHVSRARRVGYQSVVVVSAMGRAGDPYATDTLLGIAREECPTMPDRDLGLLVSCGELIAAVIVSGTLRRGGLDCSVFSGAEAGLLTDDRHLDARILRVDPARLHDCLSRGRVAVVAGFQGVSEAGEVTTLGRGGSDTTAAALAAALRVELLEIYTDVDGVKTADPRLAPTARTIDEIDYDGFVQMAYEGAKVVHPRAVEIARRNSVPMRVRNTFTDCPGTLVRHHQASAPSWPGYQSDRVITGVAHLSDLAQVIVDIQGEAEAQLELEMFDRLATAGISVDLINVFPGRKVFCVLSKDIEATRTVLAELQLDSAIRTDCAKVSVVGAGMRGVPGVMARVVRGLTSARVPILQTADSHVTISCLIDGGHLQTAVRSLCSEFGLNNS